MCQRNPDQNAVLLTGIERKLLEEQYAVRKLNDEKSREGVAVIISHDGETMSADQVKCWVDNFKSSLKQKGEEPESNDQESESMSL